MKVLLTGGTGFLGTEVLSRLTADPRIETVFVFTRSQLTHSSPKVRMVKQDLALAEPIDLSPLSPDAVIHLAGLYDFKRDFAANYLGNVVPMLNLIAAIKRLKEQPPVYFASSYSVSIGLPEAENSERPLPRQHGSASPYFSTKRMAEKALIDSGLIASIFRLGILVGRSTDGQIQKIDGAYHVPEMARRISRFPALASLPIFPIPGKPLGHLPLVPVDYAAQTFVNALFKTFPVEPRIRIYGVYNSDSTSLEHYCNAAVKHYLPRARAVFLKKIPMRALRITQPLMKIPGDIFRVSLHPAILRNPGFLRDFPEIKIPHFESYQKAFFQGLARHLGDIQAEDPS